MIRSSLFFAPEESKQIDLRSHKIRARANNWAHEAHDLI
jgi:gas vesicle protein